MIDDPALSAEGDPPPAVGLGDRPRRRPGVAHVELDGEVVLLQDGGVHLLNPVAGLLWSCFDGEGTLAEIAEDAADAFGAPLEAVQADVLHLAADLLARGLVVDEEHDEAAAQAQPAEAPAADGDDHPEDRFLVEPPSS